MEKTKIQAPYQPIQSNDKETDHHEPQKSIYHHEDDTTKENTWVSSLLHEINGSWIPAKLVPALKKFQNQFQAKDSDIILATMPKSGTTWLKALVFTITNRKFQTLAQSPLFSSNPHALVPFFEYDIYSNSKTPSMNVDEISSPMIFSTHIHFQSLTTSVLDSKCRIIYICRHPLDQFVSHWCFALENFYDGKSKPPVFEEALEKYSQGIHPFGPFWDHMLGYSEQTLKDSSKVLFLKYELLKADPISEVKKIAEFLELPFSGEEERNGVVEEVVRLCSFENLKNLEVNKNGRTNYAVKHTSFFRKGETGDWVNYVTPDMAQLVMRAMDERLDGSGISF